MTFDDIEAMPENELKEVLILYGVDVSTYKNKKDLVNKVLRL